jgi:hypothetical protein
MTHDETKMIREIVLTAALFVASIVWILLALD